MVLVEKRRDPHEPWWAIYFVVWQAWICNCRQMASIAFYMINAAHNQHFVAFNKWSACVFLFYLNIILDGWEAFPNVARSTQNCTYIWSGAFGGISSYSYMTTLIRYGTLILVRRTPYLWQSQRLKPLMPGRLSIHISWSNMYEGDRAKLDVQVLENGINFVSPRSSMNAFRQHYKTERPGRKNVIDGNNDPKYIVTPCPITSMLSLAKSTIRVQVFSQFGLFNTTKYYRPTEAASPLQKNRDGVHSRVSRNGTSPWSV